MTASAGKREHHRRVSKLWAAESTGGGAVRQATSGGDPHHAILDTTSRTVEHVVGTAPPESPDQPGAIQKQSDSKPGMDAHSCKHGNPKAPPVNAAIKWRAS